MKTKQLIILLSACCFLFPSPAVGADDDGNAQKATPDQQGLQSALDDLLRRVQAIEERQLQSELTEIRRRLSEVEKQGGQPGVESNQAGIATLTQLANRQQVQLQQILTELKSLKASQAKPAVARTRDTTLYAVDIGFSPTLGPDDAKVTIVEFTDFQCGFCRLEYPKLQEVLKTYPDEVRIVFKHFPLGNHPKAKPAHAAAILAQQELGNDAFWEFHDMVVANPKQLDVPKLREYAQTLGLDLDNFDRTIGDTRTVDALVAADILEGRKCNVAGTPTIMINGLKLAGRSIEEYKKRIDEILNQTAAK